MFYAYSLSYLCLLEEKQEYRSSETQAVGKNRPRMVDGTARRSEPLLGRERNHHLRPSQERERQSPKAPAHFRDPRMNKYENSARTSCRNPTRLKESSSAFASGRSTVPLRFRLWFSWNECYFMVGSLPPSDRRMLGSYHRRYSRKKRSQTQFKNPITTRILAAVWRYGRNKLVVLPSELRFRVNQETRHTCKSAAFHC